MHVYVLFHLNFQHFFSPTPIATVFRFDYIIALSSFIMHMLCFTFRLKLHDIREVLLHSNRSNIISIGGNHIKSLHFHFILIH